MADALIFYVDTAFELMSSYGIPRDRVFITANSPDTDRLLATFERVRQQPLLLSPNPQRLIHVGRLVKWKRVDLILEAIKDLEGLYPQIELVVVGFGPEEAALKQQAESLGIAGRVTFTGGIYDEVVLGQYLHASAVYVLAGMGGLSINDAMCFAKPVICSEADGTEKRLVRENINGKYFENGDAADLARQISFFIEDPARVRSFGENSLKIIREEVNIHTVLQEFRRAFQYAVDQGGKQK
ncbi:glycosyltransferase family 4 protein [Anseongella ginsenosidimutans]|nr:glycosyltransferase family 4 protein [Anseongella ginsenosidimutans]QEC52076.1 glycosyltransferase family 4 protein [Anseongella ginsenosidimutans]